MPAMKAQIEDKPVSLGRDPVLREFITTLKSLEVGQSFLWKLNGDARRMMTLAGVFLDRSFTSRKEGGTYRVGRVF
jgi:hypothetical protein